MHTGLAIMDTCLNYCTARIHLGRGLCRQAFKAGRDYAVKFEKGSVAGGWVSRKSILAGWLATKELRWFAEKRIIAKHSTHIRGISPRSRANRPQNMSWTRDALMAISASTPTAHRLTTSSTDTTASMVHNRSDYVQFTAKCIPLFSPKLSSRERRSYIGNTPPPTPTPQIWSFACGSYKITKFWAFCRNTFAGCGDILSAMRCKEGGSWLADRGQVICGHVQFWQSKSDQLNTRVIFVDNSSDIIVSKSVLLLVLNLHLQPVQYSVLANLSQQAQYKYSMVRLKGVAQVQYRTNRFGKKYKCNVSVFRRTCV